MNRSLVVITLALAVLSLESCSESDESQSTKDGGGSAGQAATGGSGGAGGSSGGGGSGASGGSAGSAAGADGSTDAGEDAADAPGDGAVLCTPSCGSAELCDPAHAGLDDDCNGQVDESCPCVPGLTQPCFKGDPAARAAPGCYDGSALCSEQGSWGACVGGVHAIAPDNCLTADTTGCHPIEARPFVPVALKPGTGNFSVDAAPGSESFDVSCPAGAGKCPAVQAPDTFVALQSGEYVVTYHKTVQGTAFTESCTYPLIVRAPGLRVELTWEHTTADSGVDLDVHVHEPGTTTAWGFAAAATQDCNWSNCTAGAFAAAAPTPAWFADPPATPPSPVNWWLDSVPENNTCYYAPQENGGIWQSVAKGCHNPRLDLDNVTCDFSVADPNNPAFCNPENVNIDYPPTGQWIRIAVHYYSNHGLGYAVHPEVKIFCDGGLAADLGPHGYHSPEQAVTFAASDGANANGNRFWTVADVAFGVDACGKRSCTVKPIYAEASARTPFFATDTTAALGFLPPYPGPP
jgi:hypothetical protein